MPPKAVCLFFLLLIVTAYPSLLCAQTADAGSWNFAVSGDSRNCGDVIMPSIAAGAKKARATFYWHLGDLRATYAPDEDYQNEPAHRGQPPNRNAYLEDEWTDFIQHQLTPFDPLPFFLGIGNHETVSPKTRQDFVAQFSQWLSSPPLQTQRVADRAWDKGPQPRSYYHWIERGVDFIYLDNATGDQFDSEQVSWFENVLQHASGNRSVRSVIVGMHEALPESLAAGHSMNDSPMGRSTGHRVYADLLRFKRRSGKPVYILSSHSHFYMSDIFDSDYWRSHGGVLPGWIVGTAGAVRYPLPDKADRAKEKKQQVYGFLLGNVHPDGKVDFTFQEIQRSDVLDSVLQEFTPRLVDYCFQQNSDIGKPAPPKSASK